MENTYLPTFSHKGVGLGSNFIKNLSIKLKICADQHTKVVFANTSNPRDRIGLVQFTNIFCQEMNEMSI